MSRGLGPQQKALLAALADAPDGIPVADIPALLGVQPRHGRAIVASLVRRKGADVATDPDYGRRVWSPEVRQHALVARRNMAQFLASLKKPPKPKYCHNCGAEQR